MARRILERATVTGADGSVDPGDLVAIAEDFPFVEFGILLSKNRKGGYRFPSIEWLEDLDGICSSGANLVLSGHIFGHWVRDICLGGSKFFCDLDPAWKMFDRFQLNFHAESHKVSLAGLKKVLSDHLGAERQVILQQDGVNNFFFSALSNSSEIDVVPLFDSSGGAGKVPGSWPKAVPGVCCGYAGGLSPDNLEDQLEMISAVAGSGAIWIDAETHLRSKDDAIFDLAKVRRFLEIAEKWII
jgi:hypothetical protein